MSESEYTGIDIHNARTAAAHALEQRGWTRIEFAGLYQPAYRSPDGKRFVRLVRILDTPHFELAPIAEPEPSVPSRRLDYPVTTCSTCGMEVVHARIGSEQGDRITLDAGYTGRGHYRLHRSIGPNDVPVMVAVSDRKRGFGHVNHASTCRPMIKHASGRNAA